MMAIASWVKLLAVPGPPPGPCEAKAAPAHSEVRTVDAAAKAIIRVVQDNVIAISCVEFGRRYGRQGMPVLKNVSEKILPKIIAKRKPVRRDLHSCPWRKHSVHIHVAPSSLPICVALRCGGSTRSSRRRREHLMTPREDAY